jgi:hypothetical protein
MRGAPNSGFAWAICLIKAFTCALTGSRPGCFRLDNLVQKDLKPPSMPAYDSFRFDDREGRAPLAPDFSKQDPKKAVKLSDLSSRMEALINGKLLAEGEILQS